MQKYFDRYKHNLKSTMIEIQYLLDDHTQGIFNDSDFFKKIREQFGDLEKQTCEIETIVSPKCRRG